jgi:metal-dependent hydrolase (beta-lactamase superfamily II)
MKNYVMAGAVVLSAFLFFGCGGQNKQKTEKEMNADTIKTVCTRVTLQKDSLLATLTLDSMKVTWIRDNASSRLMPRTLFPDATDALMNSLSLQEGIPASVSTFLIECDGKRMLFDTGVGAPDSRMMEGLKSLNVKPEDIDCLFITHFHGDHIGGMMKDGNDIRAAKFTFEQAVEALSDDKDTRNNKGLMANVTPDQSRTSRFQMKDLPTEVARMVDTMKVGEVSAPFTMVNSKGKTTCALVKLVSRVDGHRATITEDFQVMKDVVLAKERAQTLHDWVVNKIKQTYVRMNDRYKDCKFEYQGWIK